ncbi:C6 zinc finger domain-containing protein [Colletotrichum graminicola]|uniref:C6 zinc finger domain-containing protein n=1 Tax=Colletotrichum graminicola (strain M1.001 / M2 / FGSC 10212) TaxID=645133 RepID=E3QY48_COLGM|nr:C6 zinc finger domain-containing protein [Colletotrichum graminicola M1.001]EFQ35786.1 C6 zinc finger domain-containing protein [Colletotrichum graminicola M1.001]WDK12766.1 C6 zinc finger domain-containing protein [Colletotrichum graminicola]
MLSPTPLDSLESSGPRSQSHDPSHSHTQTPRYFGAATTTPATSSGWGLGDPAAPLHHLSSEASTSPAESWRLDEFVTDPGYLAYQEELRCLIFNTAQTAAPTREGTPEAAVYGAFAAGGFAASGTISSDEGTARRQAGQILGTGRRLEYLKNYIGEVAPWLDMFDSDRAFGIQVPVLARSSCASSWEAPLGSHLDGMRRVFSVPSDMRAPQRTPDMHANYAVYLCAKVCELVADRARHFELDDAADGCDPDELAGRWIRLWEDLQAWTRDRPPELLPVQSVQSIPLPQILFLHWAAISSNQLYHTACTLLLGSMPRPLSPKQLPGVTGSVVWHAKCICGISLANPHQGCLNNAIQPLWVVGRLLSHRSEHALLVRLIRSIETVTGWGTCWRIDDLEAAWGYKVCKELKNR